MSTIDQLNNEILELRKKNDPLETKLTAFLLKRDTQVLNAKQKQELDDDIKSIRSTISENNQIIIAKENQKTEIQRQITADKKYRAERGETTSSPMLFIFFR